MGTVGRVRRRVVLTSAAIGGTAAFLGYVAYRERRRRARVGRRAITLTSLPPRARALAEHDFDVDATVRTMRETLRNMPQSILGAPVAPDL